MAEVKKVLPTSALEGSGLALPPAFADQVVKEKGHHDFKLRNKAGQEWNASVTRKDANAGRERTDITGGWGVFAEANDLSPGDEVSIKHAGGKVLLIVPTGHKAKLTPRATPKKKAAATPKKKAAAGSAKKAAGSSKKKAAAAAPPLASPAGTSKRASSSTPAKKGKKKTPAKQAPRAAAAAAVPAEAAPEVAEEGTGGGWCTVM